MNSFTREILVIYIPMIYIYIYVFMSSRTIYTLLRRIVELRLSVQ